MALTLAELKDLISFGQEIGLQQLQTEGLVCVYGQKMVLGATPAPQLTENATTDNTIDILNHYSAMRRGAVKP